MLFCCTVGLFFLGESGLESSLLEGVNADCLQRVSLLSCLPLLPATFFFFHLKTFDCPKALVCHKRLLVAIKGAWFVTDIR
jgi:hypothetical protein